MQMRNKLTRKHLLMTGILFGLISIAVGAVNLGGSPHQSKLDAGQVQNKTSALQVVSLTPVLSPSGKAEGAVALTVKNVLSKKEVTGLVITNAAVQVQIDFISQDYTIPPGGLYSYAVQPQSKGAGVKESDISVLAAILDDQTYDGDAKTGQLFLDWRKGEKRELELLLPVLKNAMHLQSDGVTASALAEIDKVPHPHHVDLPGSVRQGSHEIRDRVVGHIQEYRTGGQRSKAEELHFLGQLYQQYSRMLSKL
ncbi:MAG TPA: hypothetical protein VN937_13175 [Blastocatellia bacterium]|nr:hypothetical protein [Blastocatellia bacterium]